MLSEFVIQTPQTQNLFYKSLPFLWVILAVSCLALAKDFFLPITLAFLLALALSPAVAFLTRFKIPKFISSFIMLAFSCALIASAVWLISPAVGQWVTSAPEKIDKVLHLDKDVKNTIDQLQQTSEKMSKAVDDIVANDGKTLVVQNNNFSNKILKNLQQAAANMVLILVLSLFMLSSGDALVVNLVRLNKKRQWRKRLLTLVRRLRVEVGQYLMAAFLINLAAGFCTSAMLWFFNIPLPWTWLVIVTLMRFVPYVGMTLVAALLFFVATSELNTWLEILLVPGLFLAIIGFFGLIVDPLVHGMRLKTNPVIVLAMIIFWSWLWGIAGAIIAVPILSVMVVVAQTMQWKTVLTLATTEH